VSVGGSWMQAFACNSSLDATPAEYETRGGIGGGTLPVYCMLRALFVMETWGSCIVVCIIWSYHAQGTHSRGDRTEQGYACCLSCFDWATAANTP